MYMYTCILYIVYNYYHYCIGVGRRLGGGAGGCRDRATAGYYGCSYGRYSRKRQKEVAISFLTITASFCRFLAFSLR